MVISALAGRTQRIIVRESETYLLAIALVIYSILSGWSEPVIGIRVIPGKSTKVKSGHVWEYTLSTIGLSTIFLLVPQILSVKNSIVLLTSLKSVNYLLGTSSNFAQGCIFSEAWLSLNSKGLLVTTPSPRGKKSKPTMLSRTLDLPAL